MSAGLPLAAIVLGNACAHAQVEPVKKDLVRIRFEDSLGRPIPYFSELFVYLNSVEALGIYSKYLSGGGFWDEALPYQDVGGGIGPSKNEETPFFTNTLDLAAESKGDFQNFKKFKLANLPTDASSFFSYHFPNGQIYTLSFDEAAKLARDKVNVLTIPGNLGSGDWKELGDFLFEAAGNWRIGKGSQGNLTKRCNDLIEKKKQAGDIQWAGNLIFVREHWLKASPRIGNFGREAQGITPEERAELPWGNTRREFGRPFGFYSYPIGPYRAFKQVLKTNPKDSRAIFWVEVLPWVNGFAPEGKTGEPTSTDFVHECKRVYLAHRDRLDDYHRFWALKEFLRAAHGATYVERYRLHLKDIHHDSDLQWAVDELDVLFKKWPFLRYQIDELGKWLAYMKNPEHIDPMKK